MTGYDWQAYATRIELGPDMDKPLRWKRRLRRWAYMKTGWSRWFWPGDWMTEVQQLQSGTRLALHEMRRRIDDPFFEL